MGLIASVFSQYRRIGGRERIFEESFFVGLISLHKKGL